MAILKDIAKVVGLNISTVSRAINGSGKGINEETKKRIMEAARQLNYYSNKKDIYLKNNSFSIGIISPDITGSFYSLLIDEIAKNLSAQGYTMINAFTNFDEHKELNLVNRFAHQSVDGIILISERNKLLQEKLRTINNIVPVVKVQMMEDTDTYDCITIDEKLGVFMAVGHFIKSGYHRIGYIGDGLCQRRFNYFKEALAQYGLHADETIIKIGNERFEEGGYLRMKELLADNRYPNAVFASYDDMAIGAMKAVAQQGLTIPGDIAIIGYDNNRASGYTQTALTTVALPIQKLGEIATELLFKKINGGDFDVVQPIKLKPQLVIRESTKTIVSKACL